MDAVTTICNSDSKFCLIIFVTDSRTLTDVYNKYFTSATVTQKLKAMLLQLQIQSVINTIRSDANKSHSKKTADDSGKIFM